MPFVKLDCGILNSTLWFERDAREVFITALLMAEPVELTEPTPQIEIGSLNNTGWSVPPGWYGLVPAASVGIIDRAKVERSDGVEALRKLGSPEESSRSKDFDGRRLVRIDGGFIVLNYMKYRERDYTAAERSRRYRERKASRRSATPSRRNITQAEVEVEVEVENERTTDMQPSAGDAPSAVAERTWNQRACESLIGRYGGTAPGGRITKALKPLVKKHGEDQVLQSWRRYLDETEAEYVSPEKFAATFGHWSGERLGKNTRALVESSKKFLASMGVKSDAGPEDV